MISVDLTKEYPRSARAKWQGVVMLARAIDKGKATAAGTNGEYNFDCPMDQAVFEFLNLNGGQLLDVIKKSDSDAHIEDYTRSFVAAKSNEEIQQFNEQFLERRPSGDSIAFFEDLRKSVAPDRTDIVTWVDVLDLDEKRDVPKRTAAAV
ncbi:MAG TPA: DUF5069 domain-containing protein [Candidatus Acidoferrum sp.]|nr:DUF5069 domain-containing protein [Candidatus Acidoferrum sp.]